MASLPLSDQEKRDLKFVFDVYDPSKNGFILPDDVIRAMTALGFVQARELIEVTLQPYFFNYRDYQELENDGFIIQK